MGENSKIEWTDHTFNPWMGCTKVSPACDGCYAEAMMDHRYGKVKWGPHGDRVRTAPSNWRQPHIWNRNAKAAGVRPRVFCASLADVFDNQVPLEWRADLFALIRATPNLIWLLLTKRPQNIIKLSELASGLPRNAAIGASVEDQVRFDLNVPALRRAKKALSPAFAFLSCEPLLGPLSGDLSDVDWVIAGGETDQGKHKARPPHPNWIRDLRDLSIAAGAAFHFKQWGEYGPCELHPPGTAELSVITSRGHHLTGAEVLDETNDASAEIIAKFGKRKAGRLLDGVEHNGFPQVSS